MCSKALLYFVSCLLIFASCTKKAVPVTPAPVKSLDIEEINFEYFHGKAKVNYKDNTKEKEVKAHIRIRKDSVIWMNLSLGVIQVGKALINKDSITIVSNVEKEVYVFDYEEMSKRFNFTVNYEIIQAAMLGNLIQMRSDNDQIIESGDFNELSQTTGNIFIKNLINKSSRKLEHVKLTDPASTNELTIDYSNFQPVGDKTFPYNGVISVIYKAATGIISNSFTFEYSKAEVGTKELKFPFNIPKKYERR